MKPLTIDWHALHQAFQLNLPNVKYFLALGSGAVVKASVGDDALIDYQADEKNYLPIGAIPSRVQYAWIERFIDTVTEAELASQLRESVNGKGAFRRFKDLLLQYPEERKRWFEFRDTLMQDALADWVAENGIQALNTPVWQKHDDPDDGENDTRHGAQAVPATHLAPVLGGAQYNSSARSDAHQETVARLQQVLHSWANDQQLNGQLKPDSIEQLAEQITQHFQVKISRAS